MRLSRRALSGTAIRDPARLEAFSDGVLAIAVTLLVLDVRVEQDPDQSLAQALHHALPAIGAFAASFLQIGIMWANHHTLFRAVARVDQPLLLVNLLLLGTVSFLPVPTALVAEHTAGLDARTATTLYCATLTASAVCFNLLWRRAVRGGLLHQGVSAAFVRDVSSRYALGLAAYAALTALALVAPLPSLLLTVVLALVFVLGPSPRTPLADGDAAAAPTRGT